MQRRVTMSYRVAIHYLVQDPPDGTTRADHALRLSLWSGTESYTEGSDAAVSKIGDALRSLQHPAT